MVKALSVTVLILLLGILSFAVFAFSDSISNSGPIEFSQVTLPGGAKLAVFRIDLQSARFACAYTNPPRSVEAFAQSDAILTVNAGYWMADYTPTDLLVVQGKTVKEANLENHHYGLFYVKKGRANVRDLRVSPLKKAERFEHAVKSGPTLVLPGGRPYTSKSVSRHARNAVGKDSSGKLFFVLNTTGRLTYRELTDFLIEELQADYAFNLDGGASVGYTFRSPDGKVHRRRGKPVSSVIQVFAK